MNQGNFQNMGMSRPAQQGNPQPGGMQRNGGASSDIRQHIMRELSNHPTPNGWQQTVPLQNRMALIQQIITQLSLVKPEYNLSHTFTIAMSFEKKEFETCPDRQTYEAHYRSQMRRIHETRQNQAEQQQQYLNPQQPQMVIMQQQMAMQGMNQNQFPPGYAIPQQAPVPNLGNHMQQHPSQIQRPVQPVNPMDMQPQMMNGQPVPNMPQHAPQNQGQAQFTPQEQQQIMQIAENMAQNVTPEQMNEVQRMVMNIPANQRQQMQNRGVNPAQAIFRTHAIKRFVDNKNLQQQRAGQIPHPLDRGVINRPPTQMNIQQGQQVPPPSTSQRQDPPFDQFLGQQQDAARREAAGQIVVPASQGAPPQVRGTPHPQSQGQFGARAMQPPNNFQQQPPAAWNTPQGQHPNVPHATQTQAPSQIQPQTPNLTNIPGQTPQQALQGQLGGLDNSRAQRTPQQNPNMPTLNRPLNPPNQAQGSQRQVQNTPTNGARNVPGGQQTAAASNQPNVGQQSIPLNVQKFHHYVASIPQPQRAAFLAQFKQKQERKKAEEAAAQAGAPSAPVAPMGGEGSKSQPAPKANAGVPQPVPNPVNRVNGQPQTNGQPQVAQPSGMQNGSRGQQQKFQPISLDENTTRNMDRVEFPRGLLSVAGENAKVPEHIKQWGQLKQWVVQNSGILPQGSIQKVVGLQSIVYQQRVAQTNQQKEMLNHAASLGNLKPAQPGVAPPAQMVAPNSSQTLVQASTTQAPNISMPILPQPTTHEITAARAQLPPNVKTASDDQIRVMLLNKRRNEYFKALAAQPNLTPLQQQQLQQFRATQHQLRMQQQANGQQTQAPIQPNQHDQLQPPPRVQNQQAQPGQQWAQPPVAQKTAQPNPQPARQPQASRSGPQASIPQPPQKGGKRINNNDDVIEVPDPKLSQQQARPPNNKASQFQPQSQPQPPTSNGLQQITSEKFNAMHPEQKAHFQEQRRLHMEAAQRASAQRLGQNAHGQKPMDVVNKTTVPNAGRDERMKELRSEVMRSMPARQPVPMSPNTRARMIEKLKSAGSMSQRLESSLPLYLSLSKDEETTKDLLRSKIAMQQQLKETQSSGTNPIEYFTMSLEELEAIETKLHQYFQMMMANKIPKTAAQPQLSAANLQSHDEALNKARAVNIQKSHANSSNRAPAAPTRSHAPFSFGGQSPQGVPQIYGPTKTDLNLVLPPITKKRKPNNNTASPSTPAQAPTPAPVNKLSPIGKTDSPDTQRPPAVTPIFKCLVANCETGTAGFSTNADLEKHIADAHEPKEPVIKDPLDAAAYAIESMRLALNLDENGKSKPLQEQSAEPTQAQAMKASLSAQGQSSIKQEAATPMSRNPTQTGPSPSSYLLKTPQAAANIKTPASEAKSTGKDTKPIASAKSPAVTAPDPWANSHVKPEWFKEVFSEVADLNRPVPNDLILDWLERNPFTPSTSPSSGVPSKDSPHKSDISANDTLNINVRSDDWFPPEWFDDGLPSDMAALDVGEFMDMDWDATFAKSDDEEEALGKGKRRRERDPLEASDEWLKAWAPDQWEEGKKKDEGRKNVGG